MLRLVGCFWFSELHLSDCLAQTTRRDSVKLSIAIGLDHEVVTIVKTSTNFVGLACFVWDHSKFELTLLL